MYTMSSSAPASRSSLSLALTSEKPSRHRSHGHTTIFGEDGALSSRNTILKHVGDAHVAAVEGSEKMPPPAVFANVWHEMMFIFVVAASQLITVCSCQKLAEIGS